MIAQTEVMSGGFIAALVFFYVLWMYRSLGLFDWRIRDDHQMPTVVRDKFKKALLWPFVTLVVISIPLWVFRDYLLIDLLGIAN